MITMGGRWCEKKKREREKNKNIFKGTDRSWEAELVIERSRVRIPAGTAGKFSSPRSTFCADSYFGIRSTPVLPQ